jgi:hypothetical protein
MQLRKYQTSNFWAENTDIDNGSRGSDVGEFTNAKGKKGISHA